MDNINQIINYLQAVISTGEIADEMQLELVTTAEGLFDEDGFTEAFAGNVEKYVNLVLPIALIELSATDDTFHTVGDQIGNGFATGLSAGIAVGILAAAAGA
jgi:hypothetical protein